MALVIALVEWLGILLGFFPCGLLDPAWPRVKSVVGLLMAVVVLALCCAFTSSYLCKSRIGCKSVPCNVV